MSTKTRGAGGYWLLAALTLLNILNFGDRFLMISFAPSIIADLGLSHFQFTLLVGFVFSLFYVTFGLFTGSLTDRLHRPRLIAAGLALWSALTAATGMARNFMEVAFARMFIGVGESALTPASISMLSDRLPRSRHGVAGAIYYLGIPIGIGSASIFASILGPMLGWRGTFMALGAVGVVASAFVLLLRDPPRGAMLGDTAEQKIGSFAETVSGLAAALKSSPVLVLTLFGTAAAIFLQGASVLDVLWWVKERGFTQVEAQKQLGLLFMVGGTLGAVLGGVGADAMYRRNRGGRLKFLALAYLFVAPLGLIYRFAEPRSLAFYASAFIGSASYMFPYGTTYATIQECVPVKLRGAAIALLNLFGAFLGQACGAALAGRLADAFTASGMDQPLTWAIMITSAPGVLAIPCFWYASTRHARTAS